MVFPNNINNVEKLDFDPEYKKEGYIWFNTFEKVFKTYVDGELQVFVTNQTLGLNIEKEIVGIFDRKEFTFDFDEAYSVSVKHNKGTKYFNYNIFDVNENKTIPISINIIDENEIKIEFVDPVSGHLFMYFPN